MVKGIFKKVLSLMLLIVFCFGAVTSSVSLASTITYNATANYANMISQMKKLKLPGEFSSKRQMYFLSSLGFLNSLNKAEIKPTDILSKEEALSIILNAAGMQQAAFLRASKIESQKTSGSKLVLPYNYLYLGYVQLAYDLKILTKKQYQDAMAQSKPSYQEHMKMTQELLKNNADTVSKAIYENRPYSYDDLIFVRSGPATRQEVCYFIVSAFKIPLVYDNVASSYPDYANIDSKFLSSVNTLLKNGSLLARDDGFIHPDDYITYDEICRILYSLEDYILAKNKITRKTAILTSIKKMPDRNTFLFQTDTPSDVEITAINGKRDFVVINDNGYSLSSALQKGDEVNLYLDSNNQVMLANVVSKANQATLQGVLGSINLKNSTFKLIKPDGNTKEFIFTPDTQFFDTRINKSVSPKDVAVGNIINLSYQNNRALSVNILSSQIPDVEKISGILTNIDKNSISIKVGNDVKTLLLSSDTDYIDKYDFSRVLTKNDFYEGLRVLAGEYCGYVQYLSTTYDEKAEDIVGGILYDIDTVLNYVEIYNQDGVKKSYRLSKKLGLKVIKNGSNSSVSDLNRGDVVYLYFNGDFVSSISASDNVQQKTATIADIQRNVLSKKPEKIFLSMNNKIYGPFEIGPSVQVFNGGAQASVDDLYPGQFVKVSGSFYGAAADIKKIEISDNHYIKNIYMAQITKMPDGTLYLSNVSIFRNNKFENVYDYKTFKLASDAKIFLDAKLQKNLPSLQNTKALIVTQNSFSDEEVSLLYAITRGSLYTTSGQISAVSNTSITLNGNRYNFLDSTYTTSSGLLTRGNLKVGDDITLISDGSNILFAKLSEGVSKPIIVRAEISEISPLDYIKVKNYAYIDKQDGWKFVNTPMTVSYDTQTTFLDVYGINNIKDLENFIQKSVYIITDGKYAKAIIDAPFGAYLVVGTLYKQNVLKNAQYFDLSTRTWNKMTSDVAIDDSSLVYIDSRGEIMYSKPQFGDEILAFVPQSSVTTSSSTIKPSVMLVNY